MKETEPDFEESSSKSTVLDLYQAIADPFGEEIFMTPRSHEVDDHDDHDEHMIHGPINIEEEDFIHEIGIKI
jgi:hypothetical protein